METLLSQHTLGRKQKPSLSFRLHFCAYNSINSLGLISKYRKSVFITICRVGYGRMFHIDDVTILKTA